MLGMVLGVVYEGEEDIVAVFTGLTAKLRKYIHKQIINLTLCEGKVVKCVKNYDNTKRKILTPAVVRRIQGTEMRVQETETSRESDASYTGNHRKSIAPSFRKLTFMKIVIFIIYHYE